MYAPKSSLSLLLVPYELQFFFYPLLPDIFEDSADTDDHMANDVSVYYNTFCPSTIQFGYWCLIIDLRLSKRSAEILGSRLKEKKC